jgi:rhodanese-related sulfurtransferase
MDRKFIHFLSVDFPPGTTKKEARTMKKRPVLKLLIAASFFFIFCTAVSLHAEPQSDGTGIPPQAQTPGKVRSEGSGDYVTIDPATLNKILAQKNFLLINVHIPYEGEIEKTDLFIHYQKIREHQDKFPRDRNAKIVLYCRSDRMSTIAARSLSELGYTRIFMLKGGMIAWKKAGYPLVFR